MKACSHFGIIHILPPDYKETHLTFSPNSSHDGVQISCCFGKETVSQPGNFGSGLNVHIPDPKGHVIEQAIGWVRCISHNIAFFSFPLRGLRGPGLCIFVSSWLCCACSYYCTELHFFLMSSALCLTVLACGFLLIPLISTLISPLILSG